MKKIKSSLVVGGNGGINHSVPLPPAQRAVRDGTTYPPLLDRVEVTKFEPSIPEIYPSTPTLTEEPEPLPPPPPQMNNVVGPPPPSEALPTDYDGYVALTKRIIDGGGVTEKAAIWATLAQAAAVNRVAEAIENASDTQGLLDAIADLVEPVANGNPDDAANICSEIHTLLVRGDE